MRSPSRPNTILTGARVCLRPLTEQDVTERYLGWLNDPVVTRHLEVGKSPVTRREVLRYLDRFRRSEADLLFAIVDRASGAHIGNVTLSHVDYARGTAQTGLMIGERAFWGKGYALEVWELLMEYAFSARGLKTIVAGARVHNGASIRTLERLGFQREGRERRSTVHESWEEFRFALVREQFRHAVRGSTARPVASATTPAVGE